MVTNCKTNFVACGSSHHYGRFQGDEDESGEFILFIILCLAIWLDIHLSHYLLSFSNPSIYFLSFGIILLISISHLFIFICACFCFMFPILSYFSQYIHCSFFEFLLWLVINSVYPLYYTLLIHLTISSWSQDLWIPWLISPSQLPPWWKSLQPCCLAAQMDHLYTISIQLFQWFLHSREMPHPKAWEIPHPKIYIYMSWICIHTHTQTHGICKVAIFALEEVTLLEVDKD